MKFVSSLAIALLFAMGVLPTVAQSGGSCPTPPPAGPISIDFGDSDCSLLLEEGVEGLGIKRLVSSDAGAFEFVDHGLFQLNMVQNGAPIALMPSDFNAVNYFEFFGHLIITFSDQNVIENRILVTVSIDHCGDEFEFLIGVANSCREAALDSVNFPRFRAAPINTNPADLFPDILQTPFGAGASFAVPTTIPLLVGIGPSNVSMQHFTYWDRINDRALYWQTKDSLGFRKRYEVQGRLDSLQSHLIGFPINNHRPGSDYISPYKFVLSAFNGDWFDGATRYREWATDQFWVRSRGPIEDNSAVSALARNTRLHVLQYPSESLGFDDFPFFAEDLQRLQAVLGLGQDEVLALWSSLNNETFNVSMPDFTGPRDSAADGYAQAALSGINILPYIQVDLWSPTGFKTAEVMAEDFAWENQDGVAPIEFAGPGADQLDFPHFRLDSSFRDAREAKTEALEDALDLVGGFPNNAGIYVDTWTGRAPELNYNEALFLKGGTPSWSLGLRREGSAFRDAVRSVRPDGILTSEFPNETLLHKTDMTYYAPFDFGQVQLPVWETVYHEFALNSSLSTTVPDRTDLIPNFLTTMHYDYHLGKVLALTNFMASDLNFIDPVTGQSPIQPVYDFMRPLLALEEDARRFRIFGRRLHPMPTSFESSITDLSFIFVGPPPASTSIWEASNGDIGILVTNASPAPQVLNIEVDFATYGLSGTYDVFTCFNGVRIPVLQVSDSFAVPFPVAPFSATLLELVPVAGN